MKKQEKTTKPESKLLSWAEIISAILTVLTGLYLLAVIVALILEAIVKSKYSDYSFPNSIDFGRVALCGILFVAAVITFRVARRLQNET